MKLRTSIDLGTMKLTQTRGCCLTAADHFGRLEERVSRSTAESFNCDWIERIKTRCTRTERIDTWIERIELGLSSIVAVLQCL
ncbi:hypothetical protein PanWU01x14_000190, partial [Parasponia andersonii]